MLEVKYIWGSVETLNILKFKSTFTAKIIYFIFKLSIVWCVGTPSYPGRPGARHHGGFSDQYLEVRTEDNETYLGYRTVSRLEGWEEFLDRRTLCLAK